MAAARFPRKEFVDGAALAATQRYPPPPAPAPPPIILATGLTCASSPSTPKRKCRKRLSPIFCKKIQNHTAVVGIVGMGYVGLPFAVEKGKVGFEVLKVGIETRIRTRAAAINRGENYIGDVKDEELRELVQSGLLRVVCDFREVPLMDVIVICVPTPLTQNLKSRPAIRRRGDARTRQVSRAWPAH